MSGRIATALILLGLTPTLAHAGAGGPSKSSTNPQPPSAPQTGPAHAHAGTGGPSKSQGATAPPQSGSGRWCVGARIKPTTHNLNTVQRAIRCLINHTRVQAHLGALRNNPTLQGVAISHSKEMVLSNYFADDDQAGLTPLAQIQSSKYRASSARVRAAENIGWGTGSGATPMRMLEAWMASPPHRENILSPGYREIGVGVAPAAPPLLAGGKRGATYTVELAARRP